MNKKALLELLNSNDFRKTLKYMRRYQAYMRNGISYDELHQMMEYDYRVFLESKLKKGFKKDVSTNITSREDAKCKFKALTLARDNLSAK